ncbi:hypothetical protein M8R19_10970 [Pseudomonas sp. R3.Fl]|uniref:O-linked N-acetylglucosamine transferase, SPINDLY family protein n=1 Tax=Pseudomonas sp. R3.Fl TaxID=2928708 RepID=UPI00201D5815|nr:hypothetical protein [Pseudomonas sp. R3.Fl]MCL6689235.1 hypothetical protein [Pseudomonas sp. R3.Fl]
MFWGLIRSFFSVRKPHAVKGDVQKMLERAAELRDQGRLIEAIGGFEAVLRAEPYNSAAMNDLAALLNTIGREEEARRLFENAALLDDTFAPALVNHAAQLNEAFQSARAMELLERARELMPGAGYIDSAMARIRTFWGQADEARELYLSAWLKQFDDNRFAENYLFNICAVEGVSAEEIYSEHAFWAGTLSAVNRAKVKSFEQRSPGKIRIGYVSPDLRQHSVRYFFRPLLEWHDRDKFEIYAYYEFPSVDEQTELIRSKCDRFYHVPGITDDAFEELLIKDDLDILIELAGHTSINRTGLLRKKLARVQLTALGYPPTTGLQEMDFKVVDKYAAPPGTERFYSERLLRLPGTFWCFDPMEISPDPSPAPSIDRGFTTFGCFGNTSKISMKMLECWQRILCEVPGGRLIIKSITFQDPTAKSKFEERLVLAGMDLQRVRLDLPDSPGQLFNAYADIDIILDTYPFNGGTTTAFALWMGVPVVTLQGEILLSRMGSSMLHELGLTELIASDGDEYVSKAVSLALNPARLSAIRADMRQKLKASPLGNGRLYAKGFEVACLQALDDVSMPHVGPEEKGALSEEVLSARALTVYEAGNFGAATRIVSYCLKRHPDSARCILLKARLLERSEGCESAYGYLLKASEPMGETLPSEIAVYLARFQLLLGMDGEALRRVESLSGDLRVREQYGLHLDVYRAAASSRLRSELPQVVEPGERFISILVHCDSEEKFARVSHGLSQLLPPQRYELLRGEGLTRMLSYSDLLSRVKGEIVVLLHEDAEIVSHDFHREVCSAMERFDVVGSAGTRRLASPLWFDSEDGQVHGALVLPAVHARSGLELCVYSGERYVDDIQAVEGCVVVARRSSFVEVPLDGALDDVGCLPELEWSYRASRAGLRVGVVPGIGVLRRIADLPGDEIWRQAAQAFCDRYEALRAAKSRVVPGGVALPLKDGSDGWLLLRELYRAR